MQRIVILELASVEQAQAWWLSPEYTAVKKLRANAANANILLLDRLQES